MESTTCKFCECDYDGDALAWLKCELEHVAKALREHWPLTAEHAGFLAARMAGIQKKYLKLLTTERTTHSMRRTVGDRRY
jgi:hypothetical protein